MKTTTSALSNQYNKTEGQKKKCRDLSAFTETQSEADSGNTFKQRHISNLQLRVYQNFFFPPLGASILFQ